MTPAELRAKRLKLGLTQTALAKRLDVNIKTIIRWESGAVAIPKVVEIALKSLK